MKTAEEAKKQLDAARKQIEDQARSAVDPVLARIEELLDREIALGHNFVQVTLPAEFLALGEKPKNLLIQILHRDLHYQVTFSDDKTLTLTIPEAPIIRNATVDNSNWSR